MKMLINKTHYKPCISLYVLDYLEEIDSELCEGFGIRSTACDAINRKLERREMDLRTHPDLIKCFEKLGWEKFNDKRSMLKVVEVPEGIYFYLSLDINRREAIILDV